MDYKLYIEKALKDDLKLEDLELLRSAFSISSATNKKARKEFLEEFEKQPEALNKLNDAIMKHADSLVPGNDPNFVCREAKEKIFQLLLKTEAEQLGMKAHFDAKGNLLPLTVENIPEAILKHYETLKTTFYEKRVADRDKQGREETLDLRMAKSINFVLYSPISQDAMYARAVPLAPKKQAAEMEKIRNIQHQIQDAEKEYITKLAMDIRQNALEPQAKQEENIYVNIGTLEQKSPENENIYVNVEELQEKLEDKDTLDRLKKPIKQLEGERKGRITKVINSLGAFIRSKIGRGVKSHKNARNNVQENPTIIATPPSTPKATRLQKLKAKVRTGRGK